MKKLLSICMLLVALVTLNIGTASAAREESTIMNDGYNFKTIHVLAVAPPLYQPSQINRERYAKLPEGKRPTLITPAMITDEVVATAKRDDIPVEILSNTVVADKLKHELGIDLAKMPTQEAFATFAKNIGRYADAYVVFTFANDSRVVMFADIYDAKTNQYLYSYNIKAGGVEDDNMQTYAVFMHKFFRAYKALTK